MWLVVCLDRSLVLLSVFWSSSIDVFSSFNTFFFDESFSIYEIFMALYSKMESIHSHTDGKLLLVTV